MASRVPKDIPYIGIALTCDTGTDAGPFMRLIGQEFQRFGDEDSVKHLIIDLDGTLAKLSKTFFHGAHTDEFTRIVHEACLNLDEHYATNFCDANIDSYLENVGRVLEEIPPTQVSDVELKTFLDQILVNVIVVNCGTNQTLARDLKLRRGFRTYHLVCDHNIRKENFKRLNAGLDDEDVNKRIINKLSITEIPYTKVYSIGTNARLDLLAASEIVSSEMQAKIQKETITDDGLASLMS